MNAGTSRRRVLALAAAAAGLLAPAAPVPAQTPIVIKFSHVVAIITPKGLAADFFAKRAAELTKGRVKVEVYPNSQLYKDNEEMEALQLGSVQMLAPSLAKFGPSASGVRGIDLPFIFDDYRSCTRSPRVRSANSCSTGSRPRGYGAWPTGTTASSRSRRTGRSTRRPT